MNQSLLVKTLVIVVLAASSTACGSSTDVSGTSLPNEDPKARSGLSTLQTRNEFDIDVFDLEVFGRSETAILLVSEDGEDVYVVDASGDELVVTDLTAAVLDRGTLPSITSPITLCDDVVVASLRVTGESDKSGEIIGFDAATGDERWSTTLDVDSITPLACTAGIVVANDGDTTAGLRASDGTRAWTAPLEPDDPPLAAGTQAVIGSYDGVAGLAIDDGQELWREGGGSDAARAVGAVGTLVELIDTYLVIAPDGSTLGELPDDLNDQIRDANDMQSGIDALEIFGSADAPVIGAVGTNVLVDMDGTLRQLTSAQGDPVEVIGASDDDVWGLPDQESFGAEGMPVQLIDSDGDVVAEIDTGATFLVPFRATSGFALFLSGGDLLAVVRG